MKKPLAEASHEGQLPVADDGLDAGIRQAPSARRMAFHRRILDTRHLASMVPEKSGLIIKTCGPKG
jgi:hypothetical protein